MLCRETSTQVTEARTGPRGAELGSVGVMEAGNDDFFLYGLGMACHLLCETHSVLLQVTTPVCAALAFLCA